MGNAEENGARHSLLTRGEVSARISLDDAPARGREARYLWPPHPDPERRVRCLRRLRGHRASVVAAVVLLGAMLTPFYDHAVVVGGLLTYMTVFLSLALGYLYKLGFETESRVEGARLRYIALVGGFGALFTLIEYLPYVGLDLPPVGPILILVFLYALSRSITHYRLIDLYELAGRLGVLTALAFVLAFILWLMRLVAGEQLFLHSVSKETETTVFAQVVERQYSQGADCRGLRSAPKSNG